MAKMKLIGFGILIALMAVTSCRPKGPDVKKVEINFELVPFFMDLHSIHPDSVASEIPELKSKYGHFLEGYSLRVIKVGPTDGAEYPEYLKSFIEYDANVDVFKECKERYANLSPLKSEIELAYKHYQHYYPQAQLPNVYLMISGFNQSMVADSGLIAVSVEKYLGADCKFYEWLSFPIYLRRKMTPEKIVPDLMKAIAYTEFPMNDSIDDVANNIIYQGKVLHFVRSMVPGISDTLLFDYSPKELEWCKKNESNMWKTMVEKRYVFDNNRLMIQKFIGDAPFTFYFGQSSSGRAAIYLGYRIVEEYLKTNPTITINQLMNETNGHKILTASGYRP